MPFKHIALIVVISLIWGLNFAVAKFALREFPPFLLTGIRFALIIAILFPFIKRHSGQMKLVLAVGLTGGAFNFGLFFLGLKLAPASAAAVFIQLNAPFAVILAILFLGEKFTRHYQIGLALAFGGVMFLSFDPSIFAYIGGLVIVAGCAMMVAVSNVLMKKLKGVGVMDLQVWIAIVSCPTILTASLIFETGQLEAIRTSSWVPWAAIVFMALGANLVGHGGVFYLLQRYEVSRISTMLLLAPLVGIFSGVLLLGEPMTLRIAFGGLVTLMGVAVIAMKPGEHLGEGIAEGAPELMPTDEPLHEEGSP